MRKLLFILMAIGTACTKKELTKKNQTFIVAPDMDHVLKDSLDNYMDFRMDYYGDHNFILENNRIFYYSQEHNWGDCIPDIGPLLPPRFINLNPRLVVELAPQDVENFVKLNVANNSGSMETVVFASARDTFESPALEKMLKNLGQNNLSVVRRITEEETVVLRHKKSDKDYYYDADLIKWDTTKIKFEQPKK